MCIICVEFQKQSLSLQEARRNLGEMVEKIGQEHHEEVVKMLDDAEAEAENLLRVLVRLLPVMLSP